ncbi:MAG: hypothetical protein ACYC9M_12815 [Desulfobulbaceae bacterium]
MMSLFRLSIFAWLITVLLAASGATAAEREDIQLVNEFGEGETVVDAISYHGNVYFFVLGDNTVSLWKTDGTGENTVLVKHIAGESVWGENIITQRNSTSLPREKKGEPLLINDNFYFFTRVNASGAEYLWQSDGTPEGTTRVAPLPEFCYGLDDAYPINGILYFLDSSCLWRTDGTGAGTWQVSGAFYSEEPPVIYKNHLYFSAFDDVHDQELWVSDGTPAGTKLFADLNAIKNSICIPDSAGAGQHAAIREGCSSSSFPGNFTVYKNELYFTAFHQPVGTELWKTDGNTVRLVKDFYPGKNSGINLFDFRLPVTVLDNKLLICAADGAHGRELWTSDGTATGTTLLKDIFPGVHDGVRCGDYPGALNNSLFFPGNDGVHGESLWKTDGTSVGTALVKDFPGANIYVTRSKFDNPVVNGRLYLTVYSEFKAQFWVTDGTAAGTSILAENINWFSGAADHPGDNSAIYNNRLLLSAGVGNSPDLEDIELWATDGTKAGTRLIKDILPGIHKDYGWEVSSEPKYFFPLGKTLLFFAGSSIYYKDDLYMETLEGLFSLTMRDITLPWLKPLLLNDR